MYRVLGSALNGPVKFLNWIWPFKHAELPISLGEAHTAAAPSTDDQLDSAVDALLQRREEWAALTCKERAALLRQCLDSLIAEMTTIAQETARVKGSYGSGHGEEMLVLLPLVVALDEYATALHADGAPKPVKLSKRANGQWVADVFPRGLMAMAFGGVKLEVWIKPGAEPTQGALYRAKAQGKAQTPAGVCAILAAGNHLCVAALDVLHELLVHDVVSAVKLNPANDFTGPLLTRALAPLHDRGFFRCLYGGADVAKKLIHHSGVAKVHMTGSGATYDAIMWGPGKPKVGKPLLEKPFTAELGCVTPIIIVPDDTRWSQADLDYHAENVLSSKFLNAGANCLSVELVVTARGWPQREEFLAALRKVMDRTHQRYAWYPGSEAKYKAFQERYPDAEEHGVGVCTRERCTSPWVLAAGVRPEDAQTDRENWCGALQEVPLDTPVSGGSSVDVEAFLRDAVDFCNGRCMGTLSAAIVIHPRVQQQHERAYQRALEDLRYGTVVVNANGGVGFTLAAAPWGAWAAAGTPEDIGTGNVLTHGTSMFDHAEKGVIYYPWRQPFTPIHFVTNTNLENIVSRVSQFIRRKNLLNLSLLIPQVLGSR